MNLVFSSMGVDWQSVRGHCARRLGPHIAERWGWDEKLQRKQHSEGWAALRFFRIVRDGASIGTVSLDEARDHVTLVGFYILPSFHRKGIGTEVLVKILSEASARRLPVRLRCLKWNPALSLYKRHGFVVTGETDTHFQMERACSPLNSVVSRH